MRILPGMWQRFSGTLSTDGTIDVVRIHFPERWEDCREFEAILSPDEVERLQRFKVEHAAIHYLLCRALLRTLLGKALQIPPAQVALTTNEYGKPRLAGAAGRGITFNLSHTGGIGMVALSRGVALGVDVEAHDASRDLQAIARRNFSPAEQRAMAALPEGPARVSAFFDIWTGKEACIKAQGLGLSNRLQRFTVALAPPGIERALSFDDPGSTPGHRSLIGLPMEAGYSASLAAYSTDHAPSLESSPPALWEMEVDTLRVLLAG
jgi:4'-phosphopantetheinyl transferase